MDDVVQLIRSAADADESRREHAVSQLEDCGPPEIEQLPRLIDLLSESSADVAYWAATLIGRCGEPAAAAAEPLAETMTHSKHANVRQRAAWALGEIGSPSPQVRSALEAAATGDGPRLARLAKRALGC